MWRIEIEGKGAGWLSDIESEEFTDGYWICSFVCYFNSIAGTLSVLPCANLHKWSMQKDTNIELMSKHGILQKNLPEAVYAPVREAATIAKRQALITIILYHCHTISYSLTFAYYPSHYSRIYVNQDFLSWKFTSTIVERCDDCPDNFNEK